MHTPTETFLQNLNPDLPDLDHLYHLGLTSKTDGIDEIFGDVTHVSMPGSGHRAFRFMKSLVNANGGSFRSLGKEPSKDFDAMAAADEEFEAVKAGRITPHYW